jgi:hypothetical protein
MRTQNIHAKHSTVRFFFARSSVRAVREYCPRTEQRCAPVDLHPLRQINYTASVAITTSLNVSHASAD